MVTISFGLLLSRITNPAARLWLSTIFGLFMGFYVFGVYLFFAIAYSLISYISMLTLPRATQMYVTVFVTGFILSVFHMHQMIAHTNEFGVSMIYMLSFVR